MIDLKTQEPIASMQYMLHILDDKKDDKKKVSSA